MNDNGKEINISPFALIILTLGAVTVIKVIGQTIISATTKVPINLFGSLKTTTEPEEEQ